MKCVVPVSSRFPSGFTLIELMIAVAIVGILAAVAYPSYTEYVNKGRRAQLAAQMMSARQFMERYYTEKRMYPVNLEFQKNFKNVPPEAVASKAFYVLSLSARTASSYTISATRSGVMQKDRCGTFTLDNFGRKGLLGYSPAKFATPAAALEYCWH